MEFGYSVFEPFRRHGDARESAAALMHWAHSTHNGERFLLSTGPDNVPSLRLAAGFGFGKIRSHLDQEDGVEDIYELDYGAVED